MSKVWLVATQTVDFGGLGDNSSDRCDEANNGVLNSKDPSFLKQWATDSFLRYADWTYPI